MSVHCLSIYRSKCKGKGGKKIKGSATFRDNCKENGENGGGSDDESYGDDDEHMPPYNDPPLGTDVDSMGTPAPTFKDYPGKDGDGDGDASGMDTDALTPSPTASSATTPTTSSAATPSAGPAASPSAGPAATPSAGPTAYAAGNGTASGADGDGGESNYTGTATAAPASSPSKVPTVPTGTNEGQGDRVVSCDGYDESAPGLTPKYVGYTYSVNTFVEKYNLTEILYAIESAILQALDDGNVPDCGVSRKLETNVHRRLDGEVVRISSDPVDMPYSNGECFVFSKAQQGAQNTYRFFPQFNSS